MSTAMGSVQITRTTALYPSAVFLQWDLRTDEAGSHLIDVTRAGSPAGPWEPVATSLPDAYHFLDDEFGAPAPANPTAPRVGPNLFSLSREVYYRITATPPSGAANAFASAPVPVEPGLDVRTRLFKRKILRDEATAFRHLNGVPLVVLKRRRWGTRCPECFDPVTRESTLEHCPVCFGTSFQDGYWAPVAIRGRKSAAPVQTQLTAHGESDVKTVTFAILDYPHVAYKDVVIDLRRDDRYEVQTVTPTELKGVMVHQSLTASLLGRNAIEYRVPIDPTSAATLY
jgi:hypothetical protein